MPASATLDLYARRNDDPFRFRFRILDARAAVDVSGWSGSLQLRDYPGQPGSPRLSLAVGGSSGSRVDKSAGAAGWLQLIIANADLNALPTAPNPREPRSFSFDLVLRATSGGDAQAVLSGNLILGPASTAITAASSNAAVAQTPKSLAVDLSGDVVVLDIALASSAALAAFGDQVADLLATVGDKADADALTGKADAATVNSQLEGVQNALDAVTLNAERASDADVRNRATGKVVTPEGLYSIADAISAGLIIPSAPHLLDGEGFYGGGRAIYVRRTWVGRRAGINVPANFVLGADSMERPGYAKFPADFSELGSANIVYLNLAKVNAGGGQLASAMQAGTQASTFDKTLLADFVPLVAAWGRQVESSYAFEWVSGSPETRIILQSPLVMQRERGGALKALMPPGFAHHVDVGAGAAGYASFANPTGEYFKALDASEDPAGASRILYSHVSRRAGAYPVAAGSTITPGADLVEIATTIGRAVRSDVAPVVGVGGTVQVTPNRLPWTRRPLSVAAPFVATVEKAITSTYFGAAASYGFGSPDGTAFAVGETPPDLPREGYWFARLAVVSDQDEAWTSPSVSVCLFTYDIEGGAAQSALFKLERIRGAREASFVGWGRLPAGSKPWATFAIGGLGPGSRDVRYCLPQVTFSAEPIAWVDQLDLDSPVAEPAMILNADPRNMTRLRAAFDRVRLGQGDAIFAAATDSNPAGQGSGQVISGDTSGVFGGRAKSAPYALKPMFERVGLKATTASFWGCANFGPERGYDERLTFGAGWTTGPATYLKTLGHTPYFNSTTLTPLGFRPVEEFSRFDVYIVLQTGGASFTVNIDGGAALVPVGGSSSTLSAAGATVQKFTFDTTLGVHTVNLQRTGGGEFPVLAVDCYDPNVSQVRIWNMGWAGSKVSDWSDASHPWSPANLLATLPTDGVWFHLGTNDGIAGDPLGGVRSSLLTRVAAAETTGDALLTTPPAVSTASETAMTQMQLAQLVRRVGIEAGAVIADLNRYERSWAEQNALGRKRDALHWNALGSLGAARLVFAALPV